MINARTELTRLVDEVVAQAAVIASSDAERTAIASAVAAIRRDSEAYQPVLMFYGTYNAGKSTLINAILGKEAAETSDAPCTDRVDEYRFGEYTIYDTPGVDAPMAHEQVTTAHLKQSHVVVFVVSTSGTFDEAETIKRLADIVKSGRPLLIVLNDKGGYGVQSPEVMEAKASLLRHLGEATGDQRIDERVPVYLVNARTALNGRLQAKDIMYQMSGVPGLEQAINKVLMATTGNQLLLPAIRQLDALITRLLDMAEKRLTDPGARQLEQQRDVLVRAKRDLLGAIETDIRMTRGRFVGDVVTALGKGQDLKGVLSGYLESVQQIVERRFQSSANEIGKELALITPIGTEGPDRRPGMAADDGPKGPGGKLLDQIDVKHLAKGYNPEAAAGVFKAGLLKMRSWKVPGIKGRWETTLGRWGGNMARGVGVALQVATVAYDVYKAHQAQAAAVRHESDRRQQMQRAADQYVIDCEYEIITQLPATVDPVFEDLMLPVNQSVRSAQDAVQACQEARRQLTVAGDDLRRLQTAMAH